MATSDSVSEAGPSTGAGDIKWWQRVGGFTAVPALIRHLGADPAALLADAALAPDALDNPDQRIPYAAMGALFDNAARQTGCPHFGLLCGRAWHLRDLGLVGDVVQNSPTIGSALRMLAVHQHLDGEGGLTFLLPRAGVVDFGYAIYAPGVTGANQVYDALMAARCNLMRELLGARWQPSEVLFPHAKPADSGAHRQFFKSGLRFDSEFCALRFAERDLEQPIAGADPGRLRHAELRADARGRNDIPHQVFRALRLQLLVGNSSADDVAEVLAIHRRTMNRRLERHGATFQEVLDQVRFEVARQLLTQTSVSIDDIAASLGYSSARAFLRSFERWSGNTPGRWRRAACTGARSQMTSRPAAGTRQS